MDKKREKYLLKTYGLSKDIYNRMVASNNGTCHICDRKPKQGKHHNIDHDHHTGEIRGLLCYYCNKFLIGKRRREHSALFSRAAAYLWREPGFGFAPVKPYHKKRNKKK